MPERAITVAIPTRNRPGFLRRAVESVLRQTWEDFELLVLDDASSDLSGYAAAEYCDPRVSVIEHRSRLGVIDNWNACIAAAKGEAICIFHDDDVMHPKFLEATYRALDAAPSVGMCFPLVRKVDCVGNDLGLWWEGTEDGVMSGSQYIATILREGGAISLPTCTLIRREVYGKVGPYSRGVSSSAFDLNMHVRIAMHYDVAVVGRVLFDYTLHPGQVTEAVWRHARVPQGMADSCLELLAAMTWLLQRPGPPPLTQDESASALLRIRQLLSIFVADQDERWHTI